jgi:hypothetical protein
MEPELKHIDGKKNRIKTMYARNGVIIAVTIEDIEKSLTIKQVLERLQGIQAMNHPAQLPEERKEIQRITDLGLAAVAEARKQLGKTEMPESLKLYLAVR